MKKLLWILPAAALLTAAAASAADDPIATRIALMKDNGGAIGVGAAMAKGELEYDPVKAALAMRTVHSTILAFPAFFPEGSESGGETRALPAIWQNKADFDQKASELQALAAAAMETPPASLDEFRSTFAAVTRTCGGCHELYRAEKD